MPKFELPQKAGGQKGPPEKPKLELPAIHEPRCKVCTSPYRNAIEKMLVAGGTYSEIARQFEFAGIERRSIAGHKEKHLNYEEAGIRQIIERQALMAQKNFEEGKERVITKQAYLQVALQKAYDQLLDNISEIPVKDAVSVIEMLSKMESQRYDVQVDELQIQFNAFLQAVKEVVPKEYWEGAVTRTHELLKASGRSVDFDNSTAEVVDAKVIEERTDGGLDENGPDSGATTTGTPAEG
jgi:CYTH domain-containing protein